MKALTNPYNQRIPTTGLKAPDPIPPYPDTGVDYAGYSKEQIQGGWRIRPQTQFWYKLRKLNPWVIGANTIFNEPGKALFITKVMIDWNMLVGTGDVEVHFSQTAATADSIFFIRANMVSREQWMLTYDFDPPVRFDRLCNIVLDAASTGAGEELNVIVWGYSELL